MPFGRGSRTRKRLPSYFEKRASEPPGYSQHMGITVTQPSEVGPAIQRAQQLNADGRTVLLDVHSNMEARRSRFE